MVPAVTVTMGHSEGVGVAGRHRRNLARAKVPVGRAADSCPAQVRKRNGSDYAVDAVCGARFAELLSDAAKDWVKVGSCVASLTYVGGAAGQTVGYVAANTRTRLELEATRTSSARAVRGACLAVRRNGSTFEAIAGKIQVVTDTTDGAFGGITALAVGRAGIACLLASWV